MTLYGKQKVLDGEKLWRVYWIDMGSARSYQKVVNWCASNGVINPVTNQKLTRMGAWFAMWNWAKKNSDVAYEIANQGAMDNADFITPERWEHELQQKVWTILLHNKRRFEKWLRLRKKENLIF